MSLLTVEGVYKDGKVELTERPSGIGAEARVIVTFLAESRSQGRTAAYLSEDLEERKKLRQQAFERMERGIDLGGPPYLKRDEFYDRFER